jgi:O-antigen ligase
MLCGLLLAALWLFGQIQRPTATGAGPQPVRTAYFVLLTCVALSFVVAMTRPIDTYETNAALLGLFALVSWGGGLLVGNDLVASPERQRTMLRRLVFAGGAIAALGVVQFVTGERWVDQISVPGMTNPDASTLIGTRQGFNRPAGTALHPIEFGYVITILLPLACNLAIADTTRSLTRRLLPVLLMGFAVVTSISRSAIICAVVGVVLAATVWPRNVRRTALAASPFVAVAVFVTIPGLLGTVLGLFTGIADDSSARSRTGSYGIAQDFFERSPLLGRGFGTFTPAYRILDNGYLLLLIETGLAGLLAMLGLVVCALWCARRARSVGDREGVLVSQGLFASAAAGGVGLALFDGLSFPMAAGMLFLVLGLIGAQRRLAFASAAPATGPPGPRRGP